MSIAYAIEATPAHASLVAARLRPADLAELEAQGTDAERELRWLLPHSDFARVLFIDHREAAIFGVVKMADGTGMPWTLTTTEVDRHQRAFWQASKYAIPFMLQRYHKLVQCIDARHDKALRWARHLGFTIDEQPHECGPLKMPYHRAVLTEL